MRERFVASVLTFLVFLLLFVGYFHKVTAFTQDLGRHLLLGRIILQTHSIPTTNLLSYTYPDFPFLNHHYLSELIFFLVYQAGGPFALLSLTTGIMLLAFGLVFFSCRKDASIAALTIVSILLLRVLFERTDIRPEICSFLLLSLFVSILYKNRRGYTKALFVLPLLMLFWVNVHIYFFIGIIVLFLFFIDFLIMQRKMLFGKRVKVFTLIVVATFFVTLINPHGLSGALYPLNAFGNYGYSIEENQTIFLLESLGFQKESVFFFKVAVVLLFLSLFVAFRKTKPIDWLLALTFTTAGFLAVRNLPLFALAVFIPLATSLSQALDKISSLVKESPLQRRLLLRNALVFLLIILLVWQIVSVCRKNSCGFSLDPGAQPAMDFFLTNNLKGPIFNNFDIGSYLAYSLYPKEKVFVDGRPEAYPASFFKDIYIPMQETPETFRIVDATYHFNTIVFSHTDQTPWAISFLRSITKNPDWKIVYLDDFIIMLLKDTEENKHIIAKFAMPVTNLQPHFNGNDSRSLLRLASFFSKIGDTTTELKLYQKILTADPENCIALYNAGVISSGQRSPLAPVYAAQYQHTCKKAWYN